MYNNDTEMKPRMQYKTSTIIKIRGKTSHITLSTIYEPAIFSEFCS